MLSNYISKLIVTVSLLFCFVVTHAQFDTTSISAKLNASREKLGKNYAFALYKDGKTIYKKEAGDFNLKTQQPIGASSQWLTAALVMTFIQEGKLSLDDKVTDYLPIFSKYYKGFITIRHCLTHYTGIQSEEGVAKLLQKNRFKSLEEEVNEIASGREIKTNPGTEFRYSNIGFDILGRVLEVVSKKPFDRLMKDRITVPLAMRNTTFTNEDYNEAINPSSGARSTASDYTNFLAMLLNNGKFNNKVILTEASVAMLHTLQTPANKITYAPETLKGLDYGMGEWLLETNANGKANAVFVPALSGTFPVIDLCRGYAFIIFTKPLSTVQKNDFYLNIKATIDDVIPASCK